MLGAQLSTDEVVSYNKITYRGLREVRIMRYGKPANDFNWAQYWIGGIVPPQARELATWRVAKEDDLDYYFLYIWWNARELVTFSTAFGAPMETGVLWYVKKGDETLQDSAELAAFIYERDTKQAPTGLWIGKEPVCKHPTISTTKGKLTVITGEIWVPERYIVVGRQE